jgi:hypothetical protein
MTGRRQFTAEQALAVTEFLRVVCAHPDIEDRMERPGADPLQQLHDSLENPDKKSVWVRTFKNHHHIILGGNARDQALARLVDFMRAGS